MRLAVIGEPCIDYIHRQGTHPNKQFGGILYSVVSLAVICNKSDEIYPVMNLGADEYDNIASFLQGFKNIKMDFITKCAHSTRVVNLYYKGLSSDSKTYDREESSTEPTLPLSFQQISPAAEMMDGILINMVSGVDLNFDTLVVMKSEFTKYIHMDIHNIVMHTATDGKRIRGPVTNWLGWCSGSDTLQMNEEEIRVISGESLKEYETAERILSGGGIKALVVTRGKKGASLYQKKIKSIEGSKYFELDKIDVPSVETRNFKDSTGCGDVFAAAFFYKSVENNLRDFSASLHFANRIASRNAALNGVEELYKLND